MKIKTVDSQIPTPVVEHDLPPSVPHPEIAEKADTVGRKAIEEGKCCKCCDKECAGWCMVSWGACLTMLIVFMPCGIPMIFKGLKMMDGE